MVTRKHGRNDPRNYLVKIDARNSPQIHKPHPICIASIRSMKFLSKLDIFNRHFPGKTLKLLCNCFQVICKKHLFLNDNIVTFDQSKRFSPQ